MKVTFRSKQTSLSTSRNLFNSATE